MGGKLAVYRNLTNKFELWKNPLWDISAARDQLAVLPFRAYGYDFDVQPLKLQEEIEKLKHTTRSVTVPPLWLPMIAHFRDINKPKSIEEVTRQLDMPREQVKRFESQALRRLARMREIESLDEAA